MAEPSAPIEEQEKIHEKRWKRKAEGGGMRGILNIKEKQEAGVLLQQQTPFITSALQTWSWVTGGTCGSF